jgi:RNA polymerase sigma-70 factor (ECF subfamily)
LNFKKTDESTERVISEGLRRGENSAMSAFYASYSGRLAAVCQRFITDDDDVKDALQESLINIFTHASSFKYKGKGSLTAWAVKIVMNQALTFLRNRRVNLSIDETKAKDITNNDNEEIDIEEIPPDIVQNMIRALPDGYRTVFNLFVFGNLSHKEIAIKLGIKENSSASQLSRAKNMLSAMAEQYRKKGVFKI